MSNKTKKKKVSGETLKEPLIETFAMPCLVLAFTLLFALLSAGKIELQPSKNLTISDFILNSQLLSLALLLVGIALLVIPVADCRATKAREEKRNKLRIHFWIKIEVLIGILLVLFSFAVFLIWQGATIAAIAGLAGLFVALTLSLTFNTNNK